MKRMSNGTDQAKCGRITRRALAALLTLCVLFACMAGTAMAADHTHTFESGNGKCDACGVTGGYCGSSYNAGGEESVWWTYQDGTLTISGSGAMADYEQANNQPWYANRNDITHVIVGNGVTAIGSCAFSNFASLVNTNISDGVTSIGRSAFSKCTSLASIDIPGSVTSIGIEAFHNCTSLTSLTIPGSVKTIEKYAFFDCTGLTEIIIPDSVTSIGQWAFAYCNNLTSVRLSNKVTSIGAAFQNCTSLTSITIPDSVTSISGAFSDCTSLTSVTIPDSVTDISSAFTGCTSLTNVTIPDSVTDISYAFYGCTSLTSITIPASVESIGVMTFEGCSSLTTVNVPCNWEDLSYDFADGVTVNKTVHRAGEKYTVNGDGTHSFTCACGETVTEPHAYKDGVCACGLVATYTVALEEGVVGVEIESVIIDDNDVLLTPGEAIKVQHGKELTVKLKNGVSTTETDVFAAACKNTGDTIEHTYDGAATLTIPGDSVNQDIYISAVPYVRVQFNLNGGAVTDAGKAEFSSLGCTWDEESDALKALYDTGISDLSGVFGFSGHTFTGVKKGGSENTTSTLDIRGDMSVDVLWKCNGSNMSYEDAKDATCTTEGSIAHYKCACDKLYAEDKTTVLTAEQIETPVDPDAHGDSIILTTGECAHCGKFGAAASVTTGGVTTYYATLDEALSAAQGKTAKVDLLKNAEIAVDHTITPNVIFDGGEFIVSGKDLKNGGTIDGGTFTATVNNWGGRVTGGSFATLYCYNGFVSGEISFKKLVNYSNNINYDLSRAVHIESAIVQTGAAELPASKLKLPDGYALAVGGQIVSELPSMGSGTIVAHSHEYTIEDFDAAQHWNQCACGAATEKVDHTFTCTPVDGKEVHIVGCSGCSYTAPEEIPHEFSGGKCACDVTPVAKVDSTYFAVFANAVAAWEVESAKAMTLLADVTYGDVIRLQYGGARTLDLNGHTLTNTVMSTYALQHFVTLTVNDSSTNRTGKFAADSVRVSVIYSDSTTLTVNGGTFTTSNGHYALNLNYANAEVNSDNVKLEADMALINVSGASDSNSLTITGSGCDGWKICNNDWNVAVPISIPYGFHLEDEKGKKLENNTELPAGAYTFIKADHVHAWSYAADDAADVITATCANTDGHCPDPELSLTLSAADAVYSGNPVQATVTGDSGEMTYELRYTGDGFDSANAPTDAGSYTVKMTAGGVRVSANFTISPKDIASEGCELSLKETAFTYSGAEPELAVIAKDNGEVFTDYETGAAQTEAGSHKLTVTGTGNYTGSVELAYTIAPKPIAISDVVIKDVVYHPDGYALTVSEVVFDGVADGDTLTIGADYTAAAELTGENAANDAAQATVTVTLTNGNYTLAEPTAEAAVRIKQSATDMTAQTDETQYAYGDTITVSGSVTATGREPEQQGFSLKRMFAAPAAMQAVLCDAQGEQITDPVSVADGRYEIEYDTKGKLVQPGEGIRLTVRFTGNASMADRQAQTNAFTLRAKELTAQLTGSTAKTYDANTAVTDVSGLSITLGGVIEGDDVRAAAASFAFDDANAGTGKTVTAEGIALDGADAPFYRLAADTAQAAVGTIAPAAAPEITFPAAAPITYGQTLADSALTGGSTAHGRFVWQDASLIPPAGSGSYTVVFIPADAHNYDYAQTEGWDAQTRAVQRTVEIAVAKAAGEARVTIESWAYGAQPNAPVPQSATHGTQNVTYLYKERTAPDSAYSAEIPAQVGEYTVRAVFAGTDNYLPISAEADFEIALSQTAFDGGLGVYNGDTQTTAFIYGDTITVRAKPVATGVSAFRRLLRAGVPQNHMALFIEDVQLCEAVAADENGVYEMTYDTAGKALSIGTSSITAQYVSDGYKADYSQSADVILDRKALTVADVTAEDRIFNAGNTTVNVTGITLSGVVGSDEAYTEAKTADTGSDQVGTYETVALPQDLELMGADAQWYTISGSESAPANAGAGVRILAVPAGLELRVSVNNDFSDEDVRETDLGNIPALDTVAEIDAALRVRVQEKGALSDSAVLYDVVLEYLDADGVTWVRADKEHFPEGGIRVVLPVIEGTTPATHTYTVAHMFTMNMRGHAAGEVEYPAAAAVQNEKGEWMLAFTVSGLSPVMIAAAPIPAVLPATGDSSSLALWMALACLSLAALAFSAKRRTN